MAEANRTAPAPIVNSQNPATYLKPDESLIGADGRDWSWCYVWFKDVSGFPGYKVGWDGSVWTCKIRCSGACGSTWKRLNLTPGRRGYLRVRTWRDGNAKTFQVHPIVLETFWGSRPPGMQGCHKDDNPGNNHFNNLKWDTPLSNTRQREERDRGCRGSRHWKAKLNPELIARILHRRREGATSRQIAEEFRISPTQAKRIIRGESWRREFAHVQVQLAQEDVAARGTG